MNKEVNDLLGIVNKELHQLTFLILTSKKKLIDATNGEILTTELKSTLSFLDDFMKIKEKEK
jgi:hypothetical protein